MEQQLLQPAFRVGRSFEYAIFIKILWFVSD